jgi:hypothetical protein
MNSTTLVQKLWNYCNGPGLGRSLARSPAREHAGLRGVSSCVPAHAAAAQRAPAPSGAPAAEPREKPRLTLRDDGMSYGDYVEQLTHLLFLKMADERARPLLSGQMSQPSPIPAQYAWPALLAKDGHELFGHYRHTLEAPRRGQRLP